MLIRPHYASAADGPALLAVFVNGQDRHIVTEITRRDGHLFMDISDLSAIGLRPANAVVVANMVALEDIRGLSWAIDERRQEIRFIAPDDALIANQIGPESRTDAALARSDIGIIFNYDLLGTQIGGTSIGTGVFEAREFTPWGVLTNSWISESAAPGRLFQRLGSTFTYSDPETLRIYSAGDVITGGLSWTRPFRLGGMQVASNFGLRPDLVTFPIPTFNGRADVPSTVDLFVNSIHQLSQPVASGPFELQRLPIITGTNSLSLVVRDAVGRESVQSLDFYISPSLLAPGLASYSIEGGWLRRNYGLPGDSYYQLAGSGTLRMGLLPWLTLDTHAEVSDAVMMGGLGFAVNLANFAVGSMSAAVSNPWYIGPGHDSSTPGMRYTAGLSKVGRTVSVSLSTSQATSQFQDVPSNRLNPVPTSVTRASLGLFLNSWGTLRLAYAQIIDREPINTLTLSDIPDVNAVSRTARVVSGTYTLPLTSNIQLYATAYHDFSSNGASGVMMGVIIPLGSRSSASLEGGVTGNSLAANVNAGQAAIAPGDIGWRVMSSHGPLSEQNAQVNYHSQYATVSAEIDHVGNRTSGRGEVIGAIAATPQGVFVANRINDSFAVVDTNGISGIAVERENRLVGHTNSSGLLLVPDLNAWQVNRLALSPLDLPADVNAGALSQQVRPPASSGIHVEFAISRGNSALVRLVDAEGKPLPAGGLATLVRTGQQVPIGFDGEVYVSGLAGSEELQLAGKVPCTARFEFKSVKDELPIIGPVACIAQPLP